MTTQKKVLKSSKKTSPAIEELPSINYALAKQLTGTPQVFTEDKIADLEVLEKLNIAANFGVAGWGRGFAWKQSF